MNETKNLIFIGNLFKTYVSENFTFGVTNFASSIKYWNNFKSIGVTGCIFSHQSDLPADGNMITGDFIAEYIHDL